jgi:hypothetical protein
MVKVQEMLGRTPRRPARRRGETDSRTTIIIVLSVLGGLMLLGCLCLIPALLLPAVQQAREAARRAQSMNNLRQIGLAMHNYHDAFRQWPPGGIVAEDGTPHQSWQYSLLPYVGQAGMFSQINADLPWTDPNNELFFRTPIPTYLNPSETETITPDGLAVSHYAANLKVMKPNGNLTIRQVTDGTSNTMVAGEVTGGLKAWGDPSNVRDPAAGIGTGANQFGRLGGQGAVILLMDGSVRFVDASIAPATLQALSTPDGGEAVPPF